MHILTGIVRAAGVLLVSGAALLTGTAYSDSMVTPGSKAAAKGSTCVAPPAEIRRYHMVYLKHDRDIVVRQGVRDVKNSLAGCVDCHAEKDGKGGYHEINAEGQFCTACHEYLAVSLTCFQCHSKKPGSEFPDHSVSGLGFVPVENSLSPALSAEEMAQLRTISRGD